MSSWKLGAAEKVMAKLEKGHALKEFELKILKGVAGPKKVPLVNPPKPLFLTEDQIVEGYKRRVGKERLVDPDAPLMGEQLLPFVEAREKESLMVEKYGANPVAWHGKYKMGFDTDDSVDTLFADSEWKRIKQAERAQLRDLKQQLRDERARRRLAEKATLELQSRPPPKQVERMPAPAAAPQRQRLVLPKKQPAPAPQKQRLLPVTVGHTGYETLPNPQSLHDLHPAAQAAARAVAKGLTRLPQISSAPAYTAY